MKHFVVLILSISLILVPCYAYADTASGSAISLNDHLWIMNAGGIKPIEIASAEASEIKAATADNTPVFINGYAMPSSMNFYYFGSGSQATTFTNSYSQLPYLFQAVTYSIAYSTQNLNTKLQSALTTLNTAISNIKTGVANINTSSGNTATNTSNIYTRLGNMNTSIDDIKSYTDGVETSLSNILTAILNQSLTIPQSLLDDVDSLATYQTKPSDLYTWLNPGYGKFDQYYVTPNTWSQNYRLYDITSSTSYLYNLLGSIILNGNTATAQYNNALWRGFQNYLDDNLVSQQGSYSNSYNSSFIFYFQQIQSDLKKLRYVLASDDEISARQAAAANTQAAVNNFVSSSGNGSFSTSNLGDLANFTSSVTDNIVPGTASPTLLVNTLNDDDVWSWFTQSTADALEPTNRLRNESKSSYSSVSHTPLLDSYYHDLEQALGVNYDR